MRGVHLCDVRLRQWGVLLGLLALTLRALPVAAAPFACVTNSGSGTVSVIATATNTVVATVPVGFSPEGVAITPAPPRPPVVCALHQLRDLVATCRFCPPDPSHWLLEKIKQAMSQVLKGHPSAAVEALQQFVHGTEHFIRKGELPETGGQKRSSSSSAADEPSGGSRATAAAGRPAVGAERNPSNVEYKRVVF